MISFTFRNLYYFLKSQAIRLVMRSLTKKHLIENQMGKRKVVLALGKQGFPVLTNMVFITQC